jgi:tRNA threonylcarbamoyladenosine biosynthesis protein TsaE
VTDLVLSTSEEETESVGETLAQSLAAGDVVLLHGDLGAGKTAFVRGLARGLGASSDDVSSPTFTLIQEYSGRLRLYHVDLYRLEPPEVDDLGLDDLISGDGVVAIEWAERWQDRPANAIRIDIEQTAREQRRIMVRRSA